MGSRFRQELPTVGPHRALVCSFPRRNDDDLGTVNLAREGRCSERQRASVYVGLGRNILDSPLLVPSRVVAGDNRVAIDFIGPDAVTPKQINALCIRCVGPCRGVAAVTDDDKRVVTAPRKDAVTRRVLSVEVQSFS